MDALSRRSELGNFTLRTGSSTVIKWEKRVLLVDYLEQGLLIAALAHELGIDRWTIHRWGGELLPDPETTLAREGPAGAAALQAGPVQGDHPCSAGGSPRAFCCTALRRGEGRRL